MAQVRQTNTLRFKKTLDSVVYYTVNGKTYARRLPDMPRAMFNTPAAKKRQALFKLVNMHTRYHSGEFTHLFDKGNSWNSRNAYVKANGKALYAALDALADRMVNGELVTATEVENAISTYATANPTAIVLADKAPYAVKYLTGTWPATITLTKGGVSTTVFPEGATSGSTTNQPVTPDDDAIGE